MRSFLFLKGYTSILPAVLAHAAPKCEASGRNFSMPIGQNIPNSPVKLTCCKGVSFPQDGIATSRYFPPTQKASPGVKPPAKC
jgi:hypothetical protein